MHRVMSALSRNLCIYPCVSGNEFGLFFEYNIYFAQYTANNNIYNKMLNIIYVNSLHYYIVTYLRLNKAIFDFLLAPLKFCADCSFKFTAFIVSAE